MTEAIHPAPPIFTEAELAADPILQFFHFAHLPAKLQLISEPFCLLARAMIDELPRNSERSAGLRKLLESKDCAVRAVVVVAHPSVFDRVYASMEKLNDLSIATVAKLAE
jgi:hypothetical protein